MKNRKRQSPEPLPPTDASEPWALRNGRWIVLIGGFLTIVVGLFAVLILPSVDRVVGEFTGGDLQRARADARSSGLALATGIGVATAGLLTWGRLELSRRQHQLDRLRDQTAERNASLQHRLAEQSQRNDRFARAIELLGHSDHAVRLGALYALEGLAKDGHEHQAVYDVICAFARLHVPQVLSADVETLGVDEQTATGGAGIDTHDDLWLELGPLEDPATSEDYEAALAIALRADPKMQVRLNLAGTVLNGLPVSALSDCVLRGSTLTGCNFASARLSRADFGLAHLRECNFESASLTDCRFTGTDFQDCSFDGAVCDALTVWPNDCRPAGVALDE